MPLNDEYDITAPFGEGYFAIVQQYKSKRTGKLVAVKRLKRDSLNNPDHKRRFENEVAFLKRLQRHDHIVTLIEANSDERGPYYVMPYASANLYDYIKAHNNTLTTPERTELFDQLLSAMRHAHSHQILHRDLSPSNVLIYGLPNKPTLAVCDFGLGKDFKSLSRSTRSSVSSYGQAYYVAPEQRASLKAATEQSDIFSLGKLLNFMMTGKDPDTIHPCDFTSIIRKATDHDPERRHDSVEALTTAYAKVKALVLASEDEIEVRTLRELRGRTNIDWHHFHKIAIEGRVVDHVYDDFLEPVVNILNDNATVRDYYSTIGADIGSFVAMLVRQIEACFGTTRWPFRATTSFGSLLAILFDVVDDSNVKATCFKELWEIAYVGDQWGVQSMVRDILSNDQLPAEVIGEVAAYIAESGKAVDDPRFAQIRLPVPIRMALQNLRQDVERRTKEGT